MNKARYFLLRCLTGVLCVPMFVANASAQVEIIRPTQTLAEPPIAPGPTLYSLPQVETDGITALVTHSTERTVHFYRRDMSGSWNSEAVLNVPGSSHPAIGWFPEVDVADDVAVIADFVNTGGPEAYVYRRRSGIWEHVQTLSDPLLTPPFFGSFGRALAIRENVIAISDEVAGVVYIFEPNASGSFVLCQILTPNNEAFRFGNALALDRKTLVVGAAEANAAYVFQEKQGHWVEQQALVRARDETAFGTDVAVSRDVLAVSSTSRESMRREGSIYMYVRRGDTWKRVQIIDHPHGPDGLFGFSVELNGPQLIALAFHSDAALQPWVNRTYLFERTRGAWRPTALFRADEQDPNVGGPTTAGLGFALGVALSDPALGPAEIRTFVFQLPMKP